ncbi:MAG: TonB-dependent receptor domain-containing protein [Flavobacterium sp.]|uniref:TonB-dependent receptor domain-containing protein n=1 Tax=Flavobacterium sp. TaxID=239 RepID=UPI003BBAB93E
MKYYYFFFLLASSFLNAQSFSINGKITLENNEKTAVTSIFLYPENSQTLVKAVVTDSNGNFIFSNIKTGNYLIKINYVGYQSYNSNVFSITDKNIELPLIALQKSTEVLKEVVIKKQKPMVQVLADKTVFNVENTINATGTSGFELLRKAPGVVIDNNDNLIVEGKSGVLIYIDGKQSFLSGADLSNYLKTIQATDIEAIEIITQPSSKYDAAGNAGIINIKLKKNKNFGTNGSVSSGYNIGRFGTSLNSLSFNNRNKKNNFYGNYSNRFGKNYNFINLNRLQSNILFDSRSSSVNETNANNIKLGYDYYANSRNTFGIVLSGNFNNGINNGKTRTPIRSFTASTIDSILVAKSDSYNKNYNLYSNINYRFQDTTGTSFNADFDYGKYNSDRTNYQPNFYYNNDESTILSQSINSQNTPITIDIFSLKSDYEQRLFKGKFGTGFKTSLVKTDNTFEVFNYPDGLPIFNSQLSNRFEFNENINAVYVNYNRLYKKFNFQFGLRVENTISDGNLISTQQTSNQRVKRSYTDFFPSGGITYQVNDRNSLAILYSNRIERPSYQSLNPFEFQIDELSFQKGNPFLRPQYTTNIKINHTYKYTLNTSLSYSYISDFFAQVTEAEGDTRNFLITRNVANQQIINLGISYPFKVKKWWSVYMSVNAYQSKYMATNDTFTGITQETLSLYGQNNFSLPKDFNLEISGWFSSQSVWGGTYRTRSLGSLDIAIQKQFLSKKLTTRLAFSDVLFTSPWRANATFPNLVITGDGGNDSRQVRFNLSYNFGSEQIKKSINRNSGLEDEKNRIGN